MTWRLIEGDCIAAMREMAARGETVRAVVTDPPYELGFMGKAWDRKGIAFQPETWRLCWEVLPPGGHLVAFGGTRTFHRMAVAIEDAGFEIRDTLMWLYGTGFPKSMNVGKTIDKAARGVPQGGADPTSKNHGRFKGGTAEHATGRGFGAGPGQFMAEAGETDAVDAAALVAEAQPWAGWGTALKPAWEPIILARKPLAGTVAANVLAHRTGAINVDGCRVPAQGRPLRTAGTRENDRSVYGGGWQAGSLAVGETDEGRWPANVLHDGSDEVEAAFAAFGEKTSGTGAVKRATGAGYNPNALGRESRPAGTEMVAYGDTGTASRFFYSAKAAKADRMCGDRPTKHPTVKPIALMRWLVRLVCPPGGVVLDPFAGSGTTGAAAIAEGMRAVLCEAEAEYQDDIRRRLASTLPVPRDAQMAFAL